MGRDRKGKIQSNRLQKLEAETKEVRLETDDKTTSNDDTYLNDDKSSNDDTSSSEDLINYLSTRDIQWQLPKNTQEEQPKPLYVPIKSEEEEPLPLHIVYPHSHFPSSTWGTNTRGKAYYGLRSLGPLKEEIVNVKKPYSIMKVTNVVLGYVNESVSCVSAFTYDKDVFPRCLNHIMSEIDEHKWALFYRIPKKSLNKGLKLLHTDNDVHSFFDVAIKNGSIHLYVSHKKQNLGKYYYKNMEWEEDDASLRKRKKSLVNGGNKGKEKIFKDEGAYKKRKKTLVNGGSKGKGKVFEDEENEGVVTIYKRAMVNWKDKMVEVEGDVKTGMDRGVVIGGKEEVVKVEFE
ncbi:hypothetical protein Tco_0459286 [Tanacetum coccineum]